MKIREVSQNLNEASFVDRLRGAVQGYQASKQQRLGQTQGLEFTKGIVDSVFQNWNRYLVNLNPGMSQAEANQAIADFVNQQFKDVDAGKFKEVPKLSNLKDFINARDFITRRSQEYVAQKSVPTQAAAPAPTGVRMAVGYREPRMDVRVSTEGGFDYDYKLKGPQGPGWYNENGQRLTDPQEIQDLNRMALEQNPQLRTSSSTPAASTTSPAPAAPAAPAASTKVVSPVPAASAASTTATAASGPFSRTQTGYSSTSINQPTYNVPTVPTGTVVQMPKHRTAGRSGAPGVHSIAPGRRPPSIKESHLLGEGGKAIKNASPVARNDVAGVVNQAKKALPAELLKNLQADIGSAGYKVQSGDIDIMVDADDVVALYGTANLADPVKAAKIMLKKHFESQGIDATLDGRNVSIGVVYRSQDSDEQRIGQVDVMVIKDVKLVAPWHQHGPRGMYNQPGFKASENFILLSSIAKHLNLKLDAFAAKLIRRDTGDVVGRTRKEVAKILLNPRAKESDLNSVQSIMQALENDPDREGKLAQARQDAEKGLINLPESAPYNTAAYFRKISDVVR